MGITFLPWYKKFSFMAGCLAVFIILAFALFWPNKESANEIKPQAIPQNELYTDKMDQYYASLYTLKVNTNGEALLLDGEIVFGLNEKIANILAEPNSIKYVIITSNGGSIFEARAVAKQIIDHQLSTRIEGDCLSACTLIFAAGVNREIGSSGRLGFHGYQLTEAYKLPFFNIEKQQQKDFDLLSSRGINTLFLERVYATDSKTIWFPTHAELLAANMITE